MVIVFGFYLPIMMSLTHELKSHKFPAVEHYRREKYSIIFKTLYTLENFRGTEHTNCTGK